MFRAVIIGFAHMHVNEICAYISEQEDFILVGIADIPIEEKEITNARYTRAWNLENNSKKYSLKPYDDYLQMLDELKPDIAFILCDNTNKPDVVNQCAKRGIDVCIEKPMATNLEQALKIKQSVDKYHIEAVINWPVIWRPYIHRQIAALQSGVIGKLTKVFYINGHTGPLGKGAKHRGVGEKIQEMTDRERQSTWWYKNKYGGGAFLDIGCYGCFFNEWVRDDDDLPISVTAFSGNYNTPYMDAPDSMAGIIEYKDSYGVIEGSWIVPQISLPTGPVFCGSDGVLLCDSDRNVVAYNIYGEKIELPEYEIAPHITNLPDHYAYCKKTDNPLIKTVTLDFNIRLMRLIDAALRSDLSGRRESVK